MAGETPDAPKKFIRTYAGDLAKAQGSDVPVESPSPTQGVPTTPAPVAQPEFPAAPPIPPPPPEIVRPTLPAPPPSQGALSAPQRSSETSPIHTFGGDFSARVQEQGASPVTVLAAEQDAARKAPELFAPKKRGNALFIAGGLMLLLAGAGGVFYAYASFFAKNAPVILPPVAPAPIFVDEREELRGTGKDLILAIIESRRKTLPSGKVRLLYTQESLAASSTVFSALRLPAPGALLRNIEQGGGMAGIVSVEDGQSPFFILSVTSYGKTFAGMLEWEPTMLMDLELLFPPRAPTVIATTTTATTTVATSTTAKKGVATKVTQPATTTPAAPVFTAGFKDEVIANHDARVYRDAENRPILVYGYWDQKTLIIARGLTSFTRIIERISTSRAQ